MIGASVRGAAHERTGTPNQDGMGWWPPAAARADGPAAQTVLLAVADGHGGAGYPCSHLGARYAVGTARRLLVREMLPQLADGSALTDLAHFKRTLSEWLPKILVRTWLRAIHRHARLYPLDDPTHDNETDDPQPAPASVSPASPASPEPPADGRPPSELPKPDSPRPERAKTDPVVRPFGSTLLAALLTPAFHLYVQLGDGDILTVSHSGQISRPPLPKDDRLLANETTSLCSPEAWRYVRVHFQPIVETPPALVLLATDGYANSFADESGFEQVAGDLHTAIRQDGHTAVARHLPDWLAATSAAGSGDDISVAVAYRSQMGVVE